MCPQVKTSFCKKTYCSSSLKENRLMVLRQMNKPGTNVSTTEGWSECSNETYQSTLIQSYQNHSC